MLAIAPFLSRNRSIAMLLFLTIVYILPFSPVTTIRNIFPQPPAFDPPTGHPPPSPIPPLIWQIYINTTVLPKTLTSQISGWSSLNPFYQHSLVDKASAIPHLTPFYASRPDILEAVATLTIPVLLSDLLRYCLLAAHGGTYTDTDTDAIQPIDYWVPSHLRDSTRAVVGIEYDRRNDPERTKGMFLDLQFCQWTIAAAPAHPLLLATVDLVMSNLVALAAAQNTTLAEINVTDEEVLRTTGPPVWSQAVMDAIEAGAGRHVKWREMSGLKEPMLFGDILVMPINSFASGVSHSGSVENSTEALAVHKFDAAWRTADEDKRWFWMY